MPMALGVMQPAYDRKMIVWVVDSPSYYITTLN